MMSELIPDIEKFLLVAIFKMASTIPQKFNIVRPFWKWQPVEIFQCRESIRDIIIYPHIKFWWYRKILNFCGIVAAILKMATDRNFHSDRSPSEEQFCVFKIFKMSVIFKMAAKTRHKRWVVKIQHFPKIWLKPPFTPKLKTIVPTRNIYL
jgi:hypothetical protein